MNQPNATSNDSRRTIQEPKPAGDTGVHPHRTIVERDATGAGTPPDVPPTSPGRTMAVNTANLGTAVTQPASGTELGTYRLVELLGEGGMGAVWKAVHTKLEKTVAVKLLPAHLTRDPAVVARFEREMKAVGKLDHPNIVRAMDAGEINGTHFLVMEFVEGLDLGQVIQKRGPRSIKDSCEMVRQAAVGLDHAHQHKLVHRDIKPSNLLLSKQGKVKILDLGLARLQGETSTSEKGKALTGFGMIMGTPDYMAPEQWEDLHTTDHRADLYALGCTLFYLLTGRAPFDDAAHPSLAKKLAAHTSEPAPDLRKERPEVSAELDAVYRKLMEKDPAARFASAGDLVKALTAIAKGQPTGLPLTESNPSIAAAAPISTAPTAVIPSLVAPSPNHAPATLPADSNLASVLSLIANETATATTQPIAHARKPAGDDRKGPKAPSKRTLWIAGGALAAVVLLGGIIIKITTRDGKTAEINVPADAKVEIRNDSDPLKVTPGDAPAADVEREAARWVLSVGGRVTLQGFGKFGRGQALPEEDFTVLQIDLGGCAGVTAKGLENLRGLKSLTTLYLTNNAQLGDSALQAIAPLTTIEDLSLKGTSISDNGLKHLAGMKGLRFFELTSTGITGAGFAHLTGFTKLTTLSLLNTSTDNAAMGNLKNFPNLATLHCWRVSDEGMKGVGLLKELNDLMMVYSTVSPQGMVHLAGLQKLQSLSISQGTIDDDSLKHLAGMRDLGSLSLADLPLTGEGLKHVPIEQLKKLSFSGTQLSNAGVREMLRFQKLESLYIGVAPADDKGLLPLGEMKQLRELLLGNAKVSGETLDSLRKALPNVRIDGPANPQAGTALPAAGSAPSSAVAPFDARQARAHQEAWAKHLGVPVEFTNPVGMKFLLVPPGEYLQGTSVAEIDALLKVETYEPRGFYERERAQRRVRISKPFYLGVHEVTQGAWKAVLQTEPWKGQESAREGNEFPANHVSWNQCQEFCRKLSGADSGSCRLPTEAEWEFACRAGTATAYSFGDQVSSLVDYAWYHGNAEDAGESYAHEVGRKKPNPFGLFDMHGNVYELCQDYYAEYGPSGATTVVDPQGPPAGADRVSRGAAWRSLSLYLRSATRGWNGADDRDRLLGFRVAMNVEAVQKLVRNLPRNGEVLHGGLVGRIQIDGKDAKVLATYASGRPFGQKNLKTILPLYDYAKQKIEIDLAGVLPLEAAEKVRIRHAGGSSSGGVATLFVDDRLVGTVGDDHDKDVTYELELTRGDHPVRWKLNGGWLGSANVIEVTGADGRTIALGHTESMLTAARREETKKQADLTGEAAKPVGSTSTKPAGATTKDESRSSDAAERHAAEWLREQKVGFEIAVEGSGRRSGLDAPLPAGPFAITQINFPPPKEGLDDAAFENLAGISKLETLGLPPGYTGEGLKHLAGMSTLKTLAIAGVSLKDEAMVSVGTFANLESLSAQGSLSQGNLTDKGFAPLANLKRLRKLYVHENEFTDAGLAHLAGMTELEDLVLSNHRRAIPKVTNAGMVHLRGMTKLRSLHVNNSGVTDEGIQHFAGMSELTVVSLAINRLTGEGLKHLPGKKLTSLTLSWTDFNEAGLKEVLRFEKLTLLHIAGTPLKDDALLDVGKIKTLTSLDLNASPYRKATVDALQKLLPECQISANKAVSP